LFSGAGEVKKTITAMSECECSNGGTSRWVGSCDKLHGLARRLCYDSPARTKHPGTSIERSAHAQFVLAGLSLFTSPNHLKERLR
jgi:hypothetical protein